MNVEVRAAIERALNRGRFFVRGGSLTWPHQARERTRWEIFRGHLLDHRQTREEAEFETWSVQFYVIAETRPQHVISLRLAGGQGPIYVTRELWIQGEETYESAPGVIETRPALISRRELVGTIDVQRLASTSALADEIATYVLQAVVGTSRLPITSVESPLPAFSFGQLGYSPMAEAREQAVSDPAEWIERNLSPGAAATLARVLELALRGATPTGVMAVSQAWQQRADRLGLPADDTLRVVRELFNQAALTPYTSLVDNLVAFLDQLVELGHLDDWRFIDLVGFMLRQLARHLAAYDLVQFHNQGANYPDALLLDTFFTSYVSRIQRSPGPFLTVATDSPEVGRVKRLRRRALRGFCALRRQYAGHPVPDLPTSPGENERVLAGVTYHVADEQLQRPAARHTYLFAGQDRFVLPETARRVFDQSVDDLDDPQELIELGTALFLDRPLGLLKDAAQADRTPLVSYQAFSRQVATARLQWLCECRPITSERQERLAALIAAMPVIGLPANRLPGRQTVGVVTLEDCQRAASDFLITRTTRQSLDELLAAFDLTLLAQESAVRHHWLLAARDVLLVRTGTRALAERGGEFLTALDGEMRPRLQFALAKPGRQAYFEVAGCERLQAGLRVIQIDGQPCNVPIPAIP